VCPASRTKLGDAFAFESRGSIEIKGIGSQETWYLVAIDGEADDDRLTPSDHLRTRSVS
jgi:hypothetical protein